MSEINTDTAINIIITIITLAGGFLAGYSVLRYKVERLRVDADKHKEYVDIHLENIELKLNDYLLLRDFDTRYEEMKHSFLSIIKENEQMKRKQDKTNEQLNRILGFLDGTNRHDKIREEKA